jgi:hypothetical protein
MIRALSLIAFLSLLGFSAQAADVCSGSERFSRNFRTKTGVHFATLKIWWEPSTQTNCAMMFHAGPAVGQKHWTKVTIGACPNNNCGWPDRLLRVDTDASKHYRYYAGPVRVYAPHQCVRVDAYMEYGPGGSDSVGFATSGFCD